MSLETEGTSARTPRPYQLDGIAWLRDKKRAFLTDGFGLGKTAQAIWAAAPEGPTLIVCPIHLMEHWRREIMACYPSAVVAIGNGSIPAVRQYRLNLGVAAGADFYIMNTEMFRTSPHTWFKGLRPLDVSGRVAIETLVIDEAHRLRGRNSKQSHGAHEVAARVARVYLLTATPVYNQPDDLYNLLALLDPVRFKSYYVFCETYLAVHHTPYGPRVLGLKKNKALLAVFKEYALGRTREDVRAQLPVLQESLIELDPGPEFYKKYEHMKRAYRDQYDQQLVSTQSVLQVLRSYTQTVKAQAVCQLLVDSCATHTLVYTYHRDLAYALGHLLKVPVITGDMPPAQREGVARSSDFVVATFPSVAEGLDFSHMQNVIYTEHDWAPGMMDQSLNRVHRPSDHGHEFTNVYHIVVKRTADAVVYKAYKHRGQTMNEIVAASLVPFDADTDESEVA